MESSKIVPFAVLSLALLVASASAADQPEGLDKLDPFGLHKLLPIKHVKCDFSITKGPVCVDCHRRLICTPLGGVELPCMWPGRHNCVEGKCESKPSDHCKTEGSETGQKDDTKQLGLQGAAKQPSSYLDNVFTGRS